MKFQKDPGRVPYLNRRDQYRMLAMVGVLCLVMVAIKLAARPASWHWLVPPERQVVEQVPALEEIDFRVQTPKEAPLPADAFRVVDADASLEGSDHAGPSDVSEIDVTADVLAPIMDNTVGLRRKELTAYELMLSRIDALPEDVIAKAARDDVAFTVIMLQPDDYRGRLITVRGDLRRLSKFPAPQDSAFDTLYEGWLFTRDSGTNPYRVVFTQRPGNVPLNETLDPPLSVRVTGYFFKRYGYVSQGGQHVAPLLLAKSPQIIPLPQVIPMDGSGLRDLMLGAIGLVAILVLGLAIWFVRSDRRYRHSRLSELAAARLDASPDDLAALQEAPLVDTDRPFADAGDPVESSPPVS